MWALVKIGACVCEIEPYSSYKVYVSPLTPVTLIAGSNFIGGSFVSALCSVVGSRFGKIYYLELRKEWVCDGLVWRRYALWCEPSEE